MSEADWTIEGMHCDGCAETIAALLSGQAGVTSVAVSYAEASARFAYDPAMIDPAVLVKIVQRAGFRVRSA